MSLDVYIKSKKKEEDHEWVANITHNMNRMAQRIFVSENKETLYDYVWRPEELGRQIDTDEMKNVLTIFNKAPAFKQGINDSFIHLCIF